MNHCPWVDLPIRAGWYILGPRIPVADENNDFDYDANNMNQIIRRRRCDLFDVSEDELAQIITLNRRKKKSKRSKN